MNSNSSCSRNLACRTSNQTDMGTKISKQIEGNMVKLITNRQGPSRIVPMLSSTATAIMVLTLTHGLISHSCKYFKMNIRYWIIHIRLVNKLSKFTPIINIKNSLGCLNSLLKWKKAALWIEKQTNPQLCKAQEFWISLFINRDIDDRKNEH